MRILAGRVERINACACIKITNRRTWFHRIRDEAVIDEINLRYMFGF